MLGVESMDKYVTIGYNLQSSKLGRKGIIKVADVEFSQDELDRIALFAPTAVVNIIRDYEVVENVRSLFRTILWALYVAPIPNVSPTTSPWTPISMWYRATR